MFVASLVRETDGSVAAILVICIDAAELSRITRLGEIVETGETYAFDNTGRLATASLKGATWDTGASRSGQ
jgi:hypothetical protein